MASNADCRDTRWSLWNLAAAVAVCCSIDGAGAADRPSRKDSATPFGDQSIEFFEKKVRPLLVKRCYECHSGNSEGVQAGLRLDSRAAAIKGGDTGPAVVPGKPAESLLIDAVNYGELYQMPPKSKLPADEIAIFTRWVDLGAPWPDEEAKVIAARDEAFGFDLAAQKAEHWAWQPITKPMPPSARDASWPTSDIDRFILAHLAEQGLAHAAAADKRTLIRRAYFDLVGLPPSPADVERFLADGSPRAFERVVDELLASPRYGERWARHWLDLVRYAETYGHEFDYPIEYAWQYRDYVIRALNADVPYDQFAVEQIAGDLLSQPRLHPTEKFNESIIGTGFWWFGEQVHAPVDVLEHEADRVDNQIDVLGKTLLGLTIGCARCHDHKFDAISTADVYALWGFAKGTRLQTAHLDPHGKIAAAAKAIDVIQRDVGSLGNAVRDVPAKDFADEASQLDEKPFADFNGDDFADWCVAGEAFGERPTRTGDWTARDGKVQRLPPGVAHSGRLSGKFAGALRSMSFTIEKPQIAYRLAGRNAQVRLIIQNYRMDQFSPLLFSECLIKVDHDDLKWHVQAGDLKNHLGKRAYIEILDNGDGWVAVDEIRFVDEGWEAPQSGFNDNPTPDETPEGLTFAAVRIAAIEKDLPAPIPVLAAVDGDGLDDRIHIRGNTRTLGDLVPRRFLTAIAGEEQPPIAPDAGSGRLELARRIVSKDNPLFARVMVNRVWHHLFGRGIVASVDNFGVLGERPSHPDLLDHLASHFIEDGYSVKRLIRAIVLSRTYQMASRAGAQADEADPGNALLHRQNLKRLEGEAIRDAILAVSGCIDVTMYGPPEKTHLTAFMFGRGRPNQSGPLDGAGRRSIYLEVRRNFLSPMMLAFDTPLPFSTVGRRNVSNVPAQALILMNDPFVAEQAKRWAKRVLAARGGRGSPDKVATDSSSNDKQQSASDHLTSDLSSQVERLFREAFARPPTDEESEAAIEFLKQQAAEHGDPAWQESPAAWTDLCHALLNAKEFIFIE